MNIPRAVALAGLALLPFSTAAVAQDAPAASDNDDLRREIEAQKQRLAILERKLEIQQDAATTAAAGAPRITASASRFQIASNDNSNFLRLRGTLFADNRAYGGESVPETADTFLLRSVRPTFEGTFGGIFDFKFTPDFGGGRSTIVDAYAAARFNPGLIVTVGKFKPSVGLERLQSEPDLRFMERGLPTLLVPNRDLGAQLSGDFAGGAFSYQLGYFNGVADGQSSDNLSSPDVEGDTGGDYAARLFFQPFIDAGNFNLRGLGFGIGSTWQDVPGNAASPYLSPYRSQGQVVVFSYRANSAAGATANNATFADGERLRLAPQFHYYRGRLGILGEYTQVRQHVSRAVGGTTRSDTLTHSAWQTQFSWFVTGEEESFRGFTPGSTWQPGKSGWGALELVARYQELDVDDDAFTGGADSFANPLTAISRQTAYGLGLNWYPWNTVKLSVNYDLTHFEGGAAGGDRPEEQALFTRFAINY
ncbi:MAG TPA: porin [Steroidobacteraceae bacterium]|nr:porin [Steroidobacteraceae bacterium]